MTPDIDVIITVALYALFYDVDISTNVTPTFSPTTHTGPVTRARARQLNYQVLSFLANPSNVMNI